MKVPNIRNLRGKIKMLNTLNDLSENCNFLQHCYARQLYQQVLLRARISYGNSVCLSVLENDTVMGNAVIPR